MMKKSFLLVAFFVFGSSVFAQKVNYINLINRANTPQIFIDDLVLPTEDGKAELSVIFRFDNNFLPFKKISSTDDIKATPEKQFYTITRLNSEIYKGKYSRKKNKNLESASRDLWVDTLYTKTFEQSESKKLYASGSLSNILEPGEYNYVLQLSLMESTNERTSNRSNIRIWNLGKKRMGEVILIKETKPDNSLMLMNLNDNVYFGKDFQILVRIPNYDSNETYTLNVSEVRTNRKDTTKISSVYKKEIEHSLIKKNIIPTLTKGKDPSILLKDTNQNYTYALISVPNSTFKNSTYILEINSSKSPKPVAKKFFKSYWPDMPASLLSLDISLDMMKYIVDEKELKKLKSGNGKEKEEKFLKFWSSKDPTPNTVYNELMAEYYRRIDYSFIQFGNQGNLAGFDSDQGQMYIKLGPPDSKERKFPTNGKVLEVWNYKNKQYVFEASTGFGDFILKTTK